MYQVMVCGTVISRHRTEAAAVAAAKRECQRAGLRDDGVYCGDAGWPGIYNEQDDRWIDYSPPA